MSVGRVLSACKAAAARAVGVREADPRRRPDFLGIGVPQGATTWLFEVLRKHPGVFLPEGKELRYFGRNFFLPLSWYESHFEGAGDRVRGEITPGYCTLDPGRVELVRAILPEARLLLTLRHPVERVWSAVRRIHGKLGGAALEDLSLDELRRVVERPGVHERADYPVILDTWTRVFPPERLHVTFHDEVLREPEVALRRILEHLGVDPDVDPQALGLRRRVNVNPTRRLPPELADELAARYAPVIEEVRRRFGDRAARWGPRGVERG